MKVFDIYTHSSKGIEAVKQGFSWPACLFSGYWAFAKGLIWIGFLIIATTKVLSVLFAYLGPISLVVDLLLLCFIGTQGNDWRRSKLKAKGYILKSTIEAKNTEYAILEFKRMCDSGQKISLEEAVVEILQSSNNLKNPYTTSTSVVSPSSPAIPDPPIVTEVGESKSISSATIEIPWDYILKVSNDNETFFNDHKTSLPEIYNRIRGKGSDPILMLVAFEQEKWRALLALLYNRQNMFFTPENFTKTKPFISNNGYCDVYVAPNVNGQTMQTGVYGLEREALFAEIFWVQGLPPMFTSLIKADMSPADTFTVVVFAAKGMRVEHLPLPVLS